jgi:integrase
VPVPDWVHSELGMRMEAAGIKNGRVFRRVSSAGKSWGDGVTEKLARHVVKEFAAKTREASLAPYDLRRTNARLYRAAGGELEQIQFLLGHVSRPND